MVSPNNFKLLENLYLSSSYTEIWSMDESSKNIKLAEPKLYRYTMYPELALVDINFCVKP